MIFFIFFFIFFRAYSNNEVGDLNEDSSNLMLQNQIKSGFQDLKEFQDFILSNKVTNKNSDNPETIEFKKIFEEFKNKDFLEKCNSKLKILQGFFLRFFNKNNFNLKRESFSLDFFKNSERFKSLYIKNKESQANSSEQQEQKKEYCNLNELLFFVNESKKIKDFFSKEKIAELNLKNFRFFKKGIEEHDKRIDSFFLKKYSVSLNNDIKMSLDEIISNFYINQLFYNFCEIKVGKEPKISEENKNALIKTVYFLTGNYYKEKDISTYIDDFLEFNKLYYKDKIVLGSGISEEDRFNYDFKFKEFLEKKKRDFTFFKVYDLSIRIVNLLLGEEYLYGKFLETIRSNVLNRLSIKRIN